MRRLMSQRPAVMYVAVLITATVVSVIGLCALAAARVQFRSAENGNEVVMARMAAESATELARHLIESDADWRTHYTHDTWTGEYPFGQATLAFKLVDEVNKDLTVDSTAPVWLYGRGTVESAVRTYRVLLEVQDSGVPSLLSNGGFESGDADWWQQGDCTLASSSVDPHSGSGCLVVKNRTHSSAGPHQTLGSDLEEDKIYIVEAWVKMSDHGENARLVFEVNTAFGWVDWTAADTYVGTTWTRVSGTVSSAWVSYVQELIVRVETNASTQDFAVDDVLFAESDASSSTIVVPVPGTWERVVSSLAAADSEVEVGDPNGAKVVGKK